MAFGFTHFCDGSSSNASGFYAAEHGSLLVSAQL